MGKKHVVFLTHALITGARRWRSQLQNQLLVNFEKDSKQKRQKKTGLIKDRKCWIAVKQGARSPFLIEVKCLKNKYPSLCQLMFYGKAVE